MSLCLHPMCVPWSWRLSCHRKASLHSLCNTHLLCIPCPCRWLPFCYGSQCAGVRSQEGFPVFRLCRPCRQKEHSRLLYRLAPVGLSLHNRVLSWKSLHQKITSYHSLYNMCLRCILSRYRWLPFCYGSRCADVRSQGSLLSLFSGRLYRYRFLFLSLCRLVS